jgi:hypothetical protein
MADATADTGLDEQKQKCITFYTEVFNKLLSKNNTATTLSVTTPSVKLPDTQVIWNRNQTYDNTTNQWGNWKVEKGRQQYILNGYVYKQFYVSDKTPTTTTYFLEYYPISNKTYLMKLDDSGLSVYTGNDKVDYMSPETWPTLETGWISIKNHIPTQISISSNAPENTNTEKTQFLTEHYEKLNTQLSERDNLLDAINVYSPE